MLYVNEQILLDSDMECLYPSLPCISLKWRIWNETSCIFTVLSSFFTARRYCKACFFFFVFTYVCYICCAWLLRTLDNAGSHTVVTYLHMGMWWNILFDLFSPSEHACDFRATIIGAVQCKSTSAVIIKGAQTVFIHLCSLFLPK